MDFSKVISVATPVITCIGAGVFFVFTYFASKDYVNLKMCLAEKQGNFNFYSISALYLRGVSLDSLLEQLVLETDPVKRLKIQTEIDTVKEDISEAESQIREIVDKQC